MRIFNKGMFILLTLTLSISCSDDELIVDGGITITPVIITDLDFTTTEENDNVNEIGVTPTSTNGTEYSIDFGDPTAVNDADVLTSNGEKVTYTYPVPTPSATYTIAVTASAENAEDVSTNKEITIMEDVVIGGPCSAETAESMSGANVNITFMTDQTQNIRLDGTLFEMAANPDSENSVNTSCNVGKVTKTNTVAWDNTQIDFDSKFNFVDNSGFSIKVFSEVPGYKVLVKLESIANPDTNTEIDIQTTKTGEWEELFFSFASSHSGKYDRLVLIFDLQQANNNTYYFDDFKYYGTGEVPTDPVTGNIAENGNFETGDLDGWAVYANGGVVIADNTENNGGAWSAKLFASPSGLNPTLKQERKAAGGISAGDKVEISFDYKGALTGESGTYSIQSFVEATDGVNQAVVFSVNPTDTWQTFTQTYTVNSGDVSGGITMEFTAICGGVQGCSSTLYLDNVSMEITR